MFHMKHPDFFSKIVPEKGADTIYRCGIKSSKIMLFKRILILPSVLNNVKPNLDNNPIVFCYILNKQEYDFSFYGLPFVLKNRRPIVSYETISAIFNCS